MFDKFGFGEEPSFFKRVGESIDKSFFIISTAIGTIFLTVGSAYAGGYDFYNKWETTSGFFRCFFLIIINPISSLFFGSIAFLIGAIGTYKDQDKQNEKMKSLLYDNSMLCNVKSDLNSTQEALQENKSKILSLHSELVTTWLKGVSKYLELDSHSRMTIYYEHDTEFYLLARYSKNPNYSKVHRQKFPLNQGVISKAWEHEKHIEKDCPHHSQYEDYCSYVKETYGYNREKIDSLNMKSCRYYAKAIIDADIHVGIILFESTEIMFFENDLPKKIDEHCQRYQGQLSKFVRDSIEFDKEINIKREGRNIFVEDEILQLMGESK